MVIQIIKTHVLFSCYRIAMDSETIFKDRHLYSYASCSYSLGLTFINMTDHYITIDKHDFYKDGFSHIEKQLLSW